MQAPATPDKDDKDWTWVIDQPCPECGFAGARVEAGAVSDLLAEYGRRWTAVLARPDVDRRTRAAVWSPLEYAAHVRDVYRIFDQRVQLMLTVDDPRFANWDQDETALSERYWESDPRVLSGELSEAASAAAATFASVRDTDWQRRGFRSNGSEFTVATIGRYFLHDVLHHLHDVRG